MSTSTRTHSLVKHSTSPLVHETTQLSYKIFLSVLLFTNLILCLSAVCVSLSTDLWKWVGGLGKDASYVHHMWQGGPGELQSHVSA